MKWKIKRDGEMKILLLMMMMMMMMMMTTTSMMTTTIQDCYLGGRVGAAKQMMWVRCGNKCNEQAADIIGNSSAAR